MARHRDVRNMDFSDDYAGYEDVYGHSVDDDYYISPANHQYIYNRDSAQEQTRISEFIQTEKLITEDDNGEIEQAVSELSDVDKARLLSCLDQVRETLGSTNISPNEMIKSLLACNFNIEKTINSLLKNEFPSKDFYNEGKVITQPPPTHLANQPAVTSSPVPIPTGKHTLPDHPSVGIAKDMNRLNTSRSNSPSSGRVTPVTQFSVLSEMSTDERSLKKEKKLDPMEQYKSERGGSKDLIHMIVIGHVDAGKSTLMGHLLWSLGQVNKKTMHKYEQESKKLGKQSFMYAWILDETGEERNRGITMDVGRFQFETKTKLVTLLDAPGHKDFIPNMICGAGQADVALLVVDATRGEFETGFELGGQTREHALLVRSLGVSQLAIAVNKLDTVSWSQERFKEIVQKLKVFLKQAGFRDKDVTYVPCSGLTGQNLTQMPTENGLLSWYDGPALIDVIDNFQAPVRPVSKPFRLSINDIFKGTGTSFCVSGRVETGTLRTGERVMVCPNKELAVVKSLSIDEASQNVVFSGDQVVAALSGIEMQNVSVGNILCDPQFPMPITTKFQARLVVFSVAVPITKGYPVILHHQSLVEPANISKLVSELNKSTGEVVKKHPRYISNNSSAIVEINVNRPIAIELYSDYKELGRITLRVGGVTIAAGLITKIYTM